MKTPLPNILSLTIAFALATQFAHAEEGTTSLEAHVHGLSELAIAMEGESLEIQFTSPAMNLVGFEHKASAPKDILAVKNAASMLRQHEKLFLFSGGSCDHVKTSIDLSELIESDEHDDKHEAHEDEHEDKHEAHEDEDEDEHDDKHEDKHAQNNNHSDIVANYQYRCENIAQLPAITVDLFEAFPGIHKINAGWVKPTQQGAATLTPNHRVVEFR